MKADLWRIAKDPGMLAFRKYMGGRSDAKNAVMDFISEKNTKNVLSIQQHHPLISECFSYPLPVPSFCAARFRPAGYDKNVFYGGLSETVTFYEVAFYFMLERQSVASKSSEEHRMLFSATLDDPDCLDITKDPDIKRSMDKSDRSYSWEIIRKNPCNSLLYPSARYSDDRCVAAFDISVLGKQIANARSLILEYQTGQKACKFMDSSTRDVRGSVKWEEVN